MLISPAAMGQNLVLCWIFGMQGCPGVEAKQGASVNFGGGTAMAPGGAKRSRVDNRTTFTVQKYQWRRVLRFFGLGGNIINASYDPACSPSEMNLPGLDEAFLKVDLKKCLNALDSDLRNYPRGIELNLLQCQEYFCQDQFKQTFSEFNEANPQYRVDNLDQFLICENPSIAI